MRISDWSSDVCSSDLAARGTAQGATSGVLNSARAASGSAAANATGSGEAMAFGNLGQLAATGSGAANGSGMFAVSPGMTIQDARGKALGTGQSVQIGRASCRERGGQYV